MTENQHPQSHPDQSHLEDCQANRRKLIKAAAGLPAMMTLASGSAQALSSNASCALIGQNPLRINPDAPLNTDSSGGTSGTLLYSCKPSNDPSLYNPPAGGSPPGSGTTYYDTGVGTPIREGVSFSNGSNQACAIYVYDGGGPTLTTTIDGTVNSNELPVAASCYTSFTLGP